MQVQTNVLKSPYTPHMLHRSLNCCVIALSPLCVRLTFHNCIITCSVHRNLQHALQADRLLPLIMDLSGMGFLIRLSWFAPACGETHAAVGESNRLDGTQFPGPSLLRQPAWNRPSEGWAEASVSPLIDWHVLPPICLKCLWGQLGHNAGHKVALSLIRKVRMRFGAFDTKLQLSVCPRYKQQKDMLCWTQSLLCVKIALRLLIRRGTMLKLTAPFDSAWNTPCTSHKPCAT